MNDKIVEAVAHMWASHPEAATLSLHWATLEQQFEAEGDQSSLATAKAIRNPAADIMRSKTSEAS